MGLFDKIFSEEPEEEEQTIVHHTELHNMIFDWFNKSNTDIKSFENDFYNQLIEHYKNSNDWLRDKLETDSKYLIELKLYGSIMYLTYHAANVSLINNVLNYLLNKDNQAYQILEYINRYDNRIFIEQLNKKNILEVGKLILKLHHALFLNIDDNFSYLNSITETVSRLKYNNDNQFNKVFDYVKKVTSNEKIYLLINMFSYKQIDYITEELIPESKFQNIIKEECLLAFKADNDTNEYKLNFELYSDFINAAVNKNLTQKWKETDYKKQKFLKPEDFELVKLFLSKYETESSSVILHFLHYFNHAYIDNPRFYKQFIDIVLKTTENNLNWYNYILSIKNKDAFYINNICTPLFKKHLKLINYSDKTRMLFENKLYEFLGSFQSNMANNKAIELLKILCNTLENDEYKNFSLLKYQGYYANLYPDYSNYGMRLDEKLTVLKTLIEDVNILTPIVLKNINKNWDSEFETNGIMTVNINNIDEKIVWNQINSILEEKNCAFRFLPVPLLQVKDRECVSFLSSLAFLNKKQFNYLINTYIPEKFNRINIDSVYRNINFSTDDTQTFESLKLQQSFLGNVDISFENDKNWKWFKDKYINKLSNKEKWFQIMSVILNNKAIKRPNKIWEKEIKQEIESHKIENYFSELNVLINSSIKEEFWFFDENKQVLKAFIWTCQFYPTENSLLILKNIIEASYTKKPDIGPRSASIGNLGLKVLVDINSNTSFGILNLLLNKTKYQRFIKAINKHIDLFKEKSDEPIEFLADKAIPNFGFINGVKKVTYTDFELEYFFKNQKLSKRWIYKGKITTAIPKEIKGKFTEIEKEISEEFKSINVVFKSIKNRIRSYWINNRTWNYTEWNKYILKNEILNPWLQNLVWKNLTTNESYILKDNKLYTNENKITKVTDSDLISLWHPITSKKGEISMWQNYVLKNKIHQTERQIFREFYPFSENELSLVETPRFNDHFLVVRKFMAIANNSGWIFTYVHEDVNWPRIFIKSMNITAHFKCDYNRNDFAIPTKGLFFTKEDTSKISYNSKFEKIKLNELPQNLLSEICRDIDLFIATTSVANDIELSNKNELLENYRNEYNYGIFSENASAKMRKSLIELISKKIGLNDITFNGNFLIITGKINGYRINLGSGFVQIKDTRKHINLIVNNPSIKKTLIPIKDDETLNIILAKALLLQNDSEIRDEALLNMIKMV